MGVTSGRTKAMEILMDAQVVMKDIKKNISNMLLDVDDSIKIDLSDDQCWKKADDHLQIASSLADPVDKDAEILKAQRALREGMGIDFSDISKEQIKARIIPAMEKVEKLEERCKALTRELERSKHASTPE